MSSAVLNAVPEVPPITAPYIPGVGRRGPTSLGGLPVGTVVRVARAGDDELYVVLLEGVERVGQVAADDLSRFVDPRSSTATSIPSTSNSPHSPNQRCRGAASRTPPSIPPTTSPILKSAPPVRGATYRADAHSVVLLCADLHDTTHAQHAPAL